MNAYLKTFNFWDVVERGGDVIPILRANATLNEIKKHDELVTRSAIALICS